MRIEREHTAALIVDFQERLVPAIADHEALMERVQILLQGLKSIRDSDDCNTAVYKGTGDVCAGGLGSIRRDRISG